MPINSFLYPAPSTPNFRYDVANSCRFNDDDSAYMHKTPGGAGNRRTFTFSAWIKRGNLGAEMGIFTAGADANSGQFFTIMFTDGDALNVQFYEGGFQDLTTNRVFRDVSAWYNIIVAVDTTQGTEANRIKIYVNGTQESSFASSDYPSQNWDSAVNNTEIQQIGVRRNGSGALAGYYDGYIAEAVLVDGTQQANTDIGEFDSDSPTIWKPIDVSGLTFGTNGFYLDYEDSGNLGNDVNGGTDLTEVNLSATDQSTDTCTNNFATLNPLVKAPSSITFSEGNLKAVHPGSWTGVPATIGVQSGKWYWECKVTTGNSANAFTGICIEDVNFNDSTVYDETGLILYFVDGRKTVDGTDTESFFSSLATNDIVGVALDLDSGTKTVTFTKNGSASGSAVNLTSNFDNKFIFPVGIGNSSSATANWEFNFGNPTFSISSGNADGNGYGNFEYSVPSGYYSINTKNLAEFG